MSSSRRFSDVIPASALESRVWTALGHPLITDHFLSWPDGPCLPRERSIVDSLEKNRRICEDLFRPTRRQEARILCVFKPTTTQWGGKKTAKVRLFSSEPTIKASEGFRSPPNLPKRPGARRPRTPEKKNPVGAGFHARPQMPENP